MDERLGSSELIREHLRDGRRGKNTQLLLLDLLRQSICSRLAGYENVNDAERLAQDPTFRLMRSERIWSAERRCIIPTLAQTVVSDYQKILRSNHPTVWDIFEKGTKTPVREVDAFEGDRFDS